MAILLGVALTVVLAVCAVAGLIILKNASADDPDAEISPGAPARSQQAASAASPVLVVPDACALDPAIATRLVPGGEEISTAYPTDHESKCTWRSYKSARNRQLSVELRAQLGPTPTASAQSQFAKEQADDKTGDKLPEAQELQSQSALEGVGEAGYSLYVTGLGVGEAVVNVRFSNVIITVRYGGNEKDLSKDEATEGAVETAKAVVADLDEVA
jgi:hypothetical protein